MTFFLNGQQSNQPAPGRVSPMSQVPTYWQSAGAQKRQFDLMHDTNARSGSYIKDDEESLITGITGVIGEEAARQVLIDAGEYPENIEVFQPNLIRQNDKAKQVLMDYARAEAEASPDAWADLDLRPEAVDERVNDRLRAEYDAVQDVVGMTPEEYTGEALLGGFGSAMADFRQAPFLFLGGFQGSILRVAGREAGINAGLELGLMPSQFEMSERLDIADPKVAQQVALAAAFGGVFGGGIAALQRGVSAYRGRQTPPETLDLGDMNPADAELLIDQIEDALINGRPPPELDIPARAPDRIPTDEGVPPPRDPQDPGPTPVREPDTIEQALSRDVDEASVGVTEKPLSDYLRNPRQIEDLGDGRTRTMQVHPEGRAADELRAMGITPRTRPGLFSRNGRKDFDNLVASEMEEIFPGIRQAVGDDGRYLNSDGFLRMLGDELNGSPSPLTANQRLNEARGRLEEYQVRQEVLTRQVEAISDDLDIVATQARMNEIKAHVDEGIRLSGLEDIITPTQRAEMSSMMAQRGGSVDDLLDAMDDADLNFAEARLDVDDGRGFAPRDETDFTPDDLPDGGQSRPGERRADGSEQEPSAEEGGSGGGGTGSGASRDGSVGREDFSDPGAATDTQRSIASDIRDQIARDGDFDMEIEIDGRTLRTADDVMKYLDEGDAFAARISLCGLG